MYENLTYEVLLQRMLDRIPNTIDKREGSVIFDALAPAAAELAQIYIEADVIMNEAFADTASRAYLIRRAAERGVVPRAASKAVLRGEFNVNVPIGARFSLGNLNYAVTEQLTGFQYKLVCETPGAEGNRNFGTLLPVDYIDGLSSAELTEILIPGEDEEDTEQLRARYFSTLDSQAFGGNVTDYRQKVNEIQGVGGLKVYPVWNGGGTVKLVLIDSQFGKPSEELILEVQSRIDPLGNQGNGVGLAPIGHSVTVASVERQQVDIETVISYQQGWAWQDVKNYAEAVIDEYFLELSRNWADSQNLIVRISQIETRLLNVPGVLDISGTRLNGAEQNLVLDKDAIPVRGDMVG
ncbi:baseplate J-like protein [Ruminiclostridium hungatei]|uniref:Baseplate J-like protein n=1 Tax=Ruminiclostridium hungatei TaxID=48256 RepID=A0A1V4SK67_RUMHU|nr:baseplate J/gp47 family protein [Ruminiclostridium hungatei]OPX43835.1 baseplate J-like protein [Ruminiclostridium hungatei]